MLRLINTIIALVVISTLAHSQEVECQNGRCDVVRKVAEKKIQEHRQSVTNEEATYDVARSPKRTAKLERCAISRACVFARLRKLFR